MQLAEEVFCILYTYTLPLLNMQCVVKKKNKKRHIEQETVEAYTEGGKRPQEAMADTHVHTHTRAHAHGRMHRNETPKLNSTNF